ncbi:hypothetical protein AK812_SmicGene31536 [Symbiodinium microadriaticum]|uniref:Uncharacterized protein n=1 Tax=Symbiodinium microadriaticum TaxID=2951 RepID=A0A1Q9CWE3_SYMMI|nr:hypothetical protein AK812_SmicGene31536 [Symbiodinium microadriaticum]
MKLSLPWLWLLSSFLWSACSWSCQSWEESRKGFWEALEARRPWRPQAPLDFLDFNCPPAAVTVLAFQLLADLEAGDGLSQDRLLQLEELLRHAFAFESLESLAAMLCSGFPVFGVLDWLAEILSDSVDGGLADCPGVRFERYGWSNQFFLGTAAAAFLAPSEVSRLYVSGVHQESSINVSGSELTEFLLGASHSFMR